MEKNDLVRRTARFLAHVIVDFLFLLSFLSITILSDACKFNVVLFSLLLSLMLSIPGAIVSEMCCCAV